MTQIQLSITNEHVCLLQKEKCIARRVNAGYSLVAGSLPTSDSEITTSHGYTETAIIFLHSGSLNLIMIRFQNSSDRQAKDVAPAPFEETRRNDPSRI